MTTIRLSRTNSNTPWGFRIHGGKDFNQPLIILKVIGGSVSEQSGLCPGDGILCINGKDATNLRHKEAQDLIYQSGNSVEFTVQKGITSTWAPSVTPLKSHNSNSQQQVYTKTSLKKDISGTGYVPRPGINSNAKPFPTVKEGQSLVNKQFNSPINMYSEQNLAETLSAQAEVLAGGAIGVNFKKNEKEYKYEDSEVYKMLKESESNSSKRNPGPGEPMQFTATAIAQGQNYGITPFNSTPQKSPVVPPQSLPSQQSLLKSVSAPTTKDIVAPGAHNPNLCAECDRLIVGVFVRIKDKNLHVECFKCSTCGQSLKNIGYFNIQNKLYCDVHAKLVAKANPPQPDLEPFTTFGSGEEILDEVKNDDIGTSGGDEEILLMGELTSSLLISTTSLQDQNMKEAGASTSIPINTGTKTFNYPNKSPTDSYATNVAPMPFHHSPTSTHHVTAPKSPNKTPSQSQLFSTLPSCGTTGGTKKIFESQSSSSSFSETITKSSGNKYIWPPQKLIESGESENLSFSSQSGESQIGTFGGGQGIPINNTSSITVPITPYNSPFTSSGVTNSSSYKPVAPPKPAFKQTQVPYKPVTNLLNSTRNLQSSSSSFGQTSTTSSSTENYGQSSGSSTMTLGQNSNYGGNAPSQAPISPSFGGPSNYGRSLVAGPPLASKAKGQFGRGFLPNRGKGILTQPGPRIAICAGCQRQIRGPFITAGGGKIYCPEHFKCHSSTCGRALIDIGYVEEKGGLYCEFCWEQYLAPECGKCRRRIKNECLNAIGQHFHPTCFLCSHCNTAFGNNPFYLEDGRPYCDKDWNEMFTTKCFACGFPIEAGDRWVEAMSNNYHTQCFCCYSCKRSLEGESFLAKNGRPFCKQHAR